MSNIAALHINLLLFTHSYLMNRLIMVSQFWLIANFVLFKQIVI